MSKAQDDSEVAQFPAETRIAPWSMGLGLYAEKVNMVKYKFLSCLRAFRYNSSNRMLKQQYITRRYVSGIKQSKLYLLDNFVRNRIIPLHERNSKLHTLLAK